MIETLSRQIQRIAKRAKEDERKILSAEKKDISLSTDKFFNTEIVSFLEKKFDYPILSEEDTLQKNFLDFTGYYWIIDPLDGTLNYSRGIPLSCISIALWNNTKPLVGVIYDFEKDELFTGVLENQLNIPIGAHLNGSPIRVSSFASIADAVLSTGFPSWRSYEEESLLGFLKKVQRWKKVRLLGSAALSLAWVGAGRIDGYIEEDIRIWDIAAGVAIVKAAGGEISVESGERTNFVTAIATNKMIKTKELL